MKKKSLFIYTMTLILCSQIAFGQSGRVNGYLIDTVKQKSLQNASVVIFNAKDSIIVNDTRCLANGHFVFTNLNRGNYILLITYPKYVDYIERFSIDSLQKDFNVGKVVLVPESIFLNDVIVSAKRIPIHLRGDTTEFDAKAVKLQANASVEDLLKKLPGLAVDNYGNITAQGRTVTKVLVDGEEFFGDDPTLVTKNLRADMIDKVQLYDKKSDQAAFTGIEDGKKEKTVNLKTKEEDKKGNFGKFEAGLASGNYYQFSGMVNVFNNDEKFAVYGFGNNTGILGLSRKEKRSYSPGDDNIAFGNNELDPWNGEYSGQGIPKTIAGGVHYNNKWDHGNLDFNGNYNIDDFSVTGVNNNITQENLPSAALYTNSSQTYNNSIIKNTFFGSSNFKIDTSSSIVMNINGGFNHKTTNNAYVSNTALGSSLINKETRTLSTVSDNQVFSGDLLYLKKFKKARRTLSVYFNQKINDDNSTGYLNSSIYSYQSGSEADISNLNQFKNNINNLAVSITKATYTEPLSRSGSLSVDYGLSVNNASSRQNSFNLLPGNAIGGLDSLYSNHYNLFQFTQKGGGFYVYDNGKIHIQIGSDVSDTHFDQKNFFNNSNFTRRFLNWYPKADFTINLSSNESISINYNGNTTLPSIEQIQPIINNVDPLNVYIGNVNLKPTFSNVFSFNYITYKALSSIFCNVYGNISFINNPITTSIQTDETGKNTFTFLNIEGTSNVTYNGGFIYGFKPNFWNLSMGVDGNVNGNKYQNISNGQLATTDATTYNVNLNLSKFKDKKYSLGLGIGVLYNTNENNLQSRIKNNFWGYSLKPSFDFYLPLNFQLHSDGDYLFQGKTQTFNENFNRFIWNSWIGKSVSKDQRFLLKFAVNDLLNQNVGFSRTSNYNFVTQNSYTTIRRYFLLTLSYSFNNFKKINQNGL